MTGGWGRLFQGRLGGGISLAIGLLSVGAVLCLRYPAWLTTPDLRPHHNMGLLRLALALAMGLGWLRYVIVTPQFHHWHHASDEEALDRNYCAHTPLWDLVFLRTYFQPKDRWPVKYGTVKPIPGGFFRQFLYPFSGPVELLTGRRDG